MKIDILILNYNGKALLEAYLSSVSEAAKRSRHTCRVHVVDNVSTDGSVEMLAKRFPEVNVIKARENRVLCSYNEAVENLDSDIVIFLNNDIKVEPDFVDHLARHFASSDVMFVAPRLMNFDNTYNGGKSHLEFRNGAVRMVVDDKGYLEKGATQAISTGAFRRKTFLELGGFDDLYLPGIWEDVDICYRGLSRGWKGVYEPESLIWHDESTTFHREFGKKGKMRIAHRNMFLFFWKNITDKGIFTKHIILTLPRLVFLSLKGQVECLQGFFMALAKLPMALGKRKKALENAGDRYFSDKELIR